MIIMKIVRFCISVIFCIGMTDTFSQNLLVKDVTLQPKEKSAVINPCLDMNGDTCALVRIITDNLEGLEFDNTAQYVKKQIPKDGVYEIYMPFALNKLSYKHEDYLAGQINFADFGFKRLIKGKTYVVRIESPETEGKVIFKVQPATASVTFDGQSISALSTGMFEIPVSSGRYEYFVAAPNYIPYKGFIQVEKSEVKTIPISLTPIFHSVNICCNVKGASVYIDGVDYGKVGRKIKISQGTHKIRISKEKYMDVEDVVNINSTVSELSYSLSKNTNIHEIHAIPITIIAKSKKIYKNNKEIKGWSSGAEIKFMPGKYMITDDNGEGVEIEVIDKPFVVNLHEGRTNSSEESWSDAIRTRSSDTERTRRGSIRNTIYSNPRYTR